MKKTKDVILFRFILLFELQLKYKGRFPSDTL